MRPSLLALLLAGCGQVHFVDPNPPRLFQTAVKYTSGAVDEPVVWIAIFNLFFQDATGCAWAREATLSSLRQGFAVAGARQLELAAQDLSPDCRQRGQRQLDVAAVQTAFANAQAVFPGAHVRPVIVYVDDIDLVAPSETAAAIGVVRSGPGGQALLWTVAYEPVTTQLRPDRSIDWGYAGDAALATRLAAMVKADLPLQTTASPSSGPVPLLDGAQLETTREFKVCKVPDGNAAGYPAVGVMHVLDRARPPTVTFTVPQRVALPRSLFQSSTFSVAVEGCTADCDRYFIGNPGDDPLRWDEADRCLLVNG